MKTLHFLTGLPESGQSLLASILRQNALLDLTNTGLPESIGRMMQSFDQTTPPETIVSGIRSVVEAQSAGDRPIILDKNLNWSLPQLIQLMGAVLERPPKIIVMVRSVPECAASLFGKLPPEEFDNAVQYGDDLDLLKNTYVAIQSGYQQSPECFLFVEYSDLISDPKQQLERIHNFLDLPPFEYDTSSLTKIDLDAREVLKHHYASFCQGEFWLKKPRTTPEFHRLDLQLAAAVQGNFAEAWRISQELAKDEPNNHRAAFNRGWYLLRQGQIQQGYQLMDRGRLVGVFGNRKPQNLGPNWDGKSKGIVLLHLEGGLGDQIHQVRYAKPIADRGCKVIVACSAALASLFWDVAGVSGVVAHEVMQGVLHHYYVSGMSSVVPLGFELEDLSGDPYITKPITIKSPRRRIGLRWQGSSHFEKEHNKKFPPELMFEALKDVKAEFVSLQRDEGAEECPSWVNQVPLNTWEETRQACASCDLVISSCTSVSHLAAAMGINTYVVIPVMPYFLYALDGPTTPYYNSMTLIRQKVFGNWEAPFNEIAEKLK